MVKKLFIAIAVLGVGAVGMGYYYWTQATTLPSWYQGQSSDPQNYLQPSDLPPPSTKKDGMMVATKQKIQEQVQTTIQQQGIGQPQQEMDVTFNSQDVNALVQSEISSQLQSKTGKTRSRHLLAALPNIQTNIVKNNLEIGTVINPTKLETLDLSRQQKAMVDKVVTSFPQLKDQDIYIGIEGQPQLKNGQLTLANDSQVKIGKLTFTLTEVAQKLGVSPARLQQSLNLNVDPLNLQDLQLKDNEVILKVNPSDYASQ